MNDQTPSNSLINWALILMAASLALIFLGSRGVPFTAPLGGWLFAISMALGLIDFGRNIYIGLRPTRGSSHRTP